mgnify:CR=1 FL=1
MAYPSEEMLVKICMAAVDKRFNFVQVSLLTTLWSFAYGFKAIWHAASSEHVPVVTIHEMIPNSHVVRLKTQSLCEIIRRLEPIQMLVDMSLMEASDQSNVNKIFLIPHERAQCARHLVCS